MFGKNKVYVIAVDNMCIGLEIVLISFYLKNI